MGFGAYHLRGKLKAVCEIFRTYRSIRKRIYLIELVVRYFDDNEREVEIQNPVLRQSVF